MLHLFTLQCSKLSHTVQGIKRCIYSAMHTLYVNQPIWHSYRNRIITQLNGSHIPLTSDEALFVPSDNKMPNSVFSCLRICEQRQKQVNKTVTNDSLVHKLYMYIVHTCNSKQKHSISYRWSEIVLMNNSASL